MSASFHLEPAMMKMQVKEDEAEVNDSEQD